MSFKKLFVGASAVLLGFSLLIGGAAAGNKMTPALKASIARGKFLVDIIGCTECHTPFKMDPKLHEPVPDMSRYLSGCPQGSKPLDLNLTPDQAAWNIFQNQFTGPWGTSFPANLTPDKETGIGNWTFQDFERVFRQGKYKSQWSHRGDGRPIMPIMPWQDIAHLSNQDLHNVFNYLQSIKPVKNEVPEYVPPSKK